MKNPFDFKGCQFASLTYTNKQGEVSNYHVLLGFNYDTVQIANAEILANANFVEKDKEIARMNMLGTILTNLNHKKTKASQAQSDTYEYLHTGVKVHVGKNEALNGRIYITAKVLKKTQTKAQKVQTEKNIASGNFEVKKVVKNGAKVLLDKEISKALDLQSNRPMNFIFEKGSLDSGRINGSTLVMA